MRPLRILHAGGLSPSSHGSTAAALPNAPAPAQADATPLAHLRALIRWEPPVGRMIAQACGYDSHRLATLCGCSVRRLQQVFREERQVPPHFWLQQHKLLVEWETLIQLDADGELSCLKGVVADWGYSSLANFYRMFERVFDLPPKKLLTQREAVLKRFGIDLTVRRAASRSHPLVAEEFRRFVF